MRLLNVYFNDIYCGELKELDDSYEFKYSNDYLNSKSPRPISLTLPLSKETYRSKELFSFFDGLIPEGYLLELLLNRYQLKVTDRFSLLIKCGLDTIGAVTLREK